MKKRLKKKKHLGEFQELGFKIEIGHTQELTALEIDAMHDFFIDMCDYNDCILGWGSTFKENSTFIIEFGKKGNFTHQYFDEKRLDIIKQLEHFIINPDDVIFGDIKDLWYDEV